MTTPSHIAYRLVEGHRPPSPSPGNDASPVSACVKLMSLPYQMGTAETIEAINSAEIRGAAAFPQLSMTGRVSDRGSVSLSESESDETPTFPFAFSRTKEPGESSSSEQSDPVPAGIPLAKRLSSILQPPLTLCMSPTGPLWWPGELMEFQRDGIRVLIERPGVLLADDMGLGKTIQAASAMRLLARRREVETVLVVAPAGLLRNWRTELERWAPELRTIEVSGPRDQRLWKWKARVHVKIVSYEALLNDSQFVARQGVSFDLVCLDEAQRIKNRETAISAAVRDIPCSRRWALTGTPLENSLDDVRSILSFVEPDMEGRAHGPLRDDEIPPTLKRLQLRRRKSEVLTQLPPKRTIELFVKLSREQRTEYESLREGGVRDLLDAGESCTVTDVLALVTRLKQICNFSTGGRRSSKMEDMAARLATLRAEGQKAIVFSQFTSAMYGVRRIADALREFHPLIYTGDLSARQRLQAVDTFERDPDTGLLILSLKAGGVGLNLQCASYVFHFDRWWNPASEAQAEDRSHRIGQTRGVSVYKYICEDTIEERIHEILAAKKALFTEYVDDVCLDLRQRLTEEELFGLLGLTPPKGRAPGTSGHKNDGAKHHQ